jgi:hypothetical protein
MAIKSCTENLFRSNSIGEGVAEDAELEQILYHGLRINAMSVLSIQPTLPLSTKPDMSPHMASCSDYFMHVAAWDMHIWKFFSQNIYPFHAEFDRAGMIDGDVRIAGALLLNSQAQASFRFMVLGIPPTIDINGTSLILEGIWGKTDVIHCNERWWGYLQVMSRGQLYKEKTAEGMKAIIQSLGTYQTLLESSVKSDPPSI